MSVTADGWENRKLFKVQRVKVKSVLEGSQGHAYCVSLIIVTAALNHLFNSLHINSVKKKYLINHSLLYINFIEKKALRVTLCFKNYR